MTKQELEQKTSEINNESNTSAEEKTRRINFLNKVYSENQTRIADEAKQKQQTAEAQLKSKMQTAYMQNPVATDEDFERDYPAMKSDYLRGEAMKKDGIARDSQAKIVRDSF